MSPRFHEFWSLALHGFHGIAYPEWGDPRDPHLLLPSTVEQMQATNSLARVVRLSGIGLAPWLASDEQVAIVRDFLGSPVLP